MAKASLQALLRDDEDYLRVNRLRLWAKDDPKAVQARRVCARRHDSTYYMEAFERRTAETAANIAIVLIRQADVLLARP